MNVSFEEDKENDSCLCNQPPFSRKRQLLDLLSRTRARNTCWAQLCIKQIDRA